MDTQNVVGRILVQCKLRNWSISKLTKECGFSQNTIYLWFHGKSKPSLESIDKICSVLNISLADFFSDSYKGRDSLLQELFSIFNKLDEKNQDKIIQVAKQLCDE